MPKKVRSGRYGTRIVNRSQRLQRVGSCIVLVAVLLAIMGLIFTIVAYGNSDAQGRVVGFYIAGPFLITLSIISFIIGLILFKMTEPNLYWCYINCPNSKKDAFVCCLCFACYLFAQHNSRGDNSRSQIPQSDPPKSILSTSGQLKDTDKQSHNHVRFDGYADSETAGSDLSTSSTSLQRHCRIHPLHGSDGSLNSVHSHQLPDTCVQGPVKSGNHRSTSLREEPGRPASASDVTTVFVLNTHV